MGAHLGLNRYFLLVESNQRIHFYLVKKQYSTKFFFCLGKQRDIFSCRNKVRFLFAWENNTMFSFAWENKNRDL